MPSQREGIPECSWQSTLIVSYNTIWHQGREDHPRWNDKHRHKNCCHKPRGFQHSTHTVMSTLQSDAPTQLSTWQKYYAIILPHSAKVQSPQQSLRNRPPQQTLRNRPPQQTLRNRPPTQCARVTQLLGMEDSGNYLENY